MDLAVLEVDGLKLEPVAFGDASQLRKGQFVFVLGNPYGIARHGEVSASWGIIANLERQAPRVAEQSRAQLGKETLHHYGTLIQTDARLNLGTSGGALIDLRGQMIGLTTALAAQAGYEQPAGFAIPVDEAFQRTLEALKAGRRAEYGFLGVGPEPRSLNSRRKGSSGALIADVIPGTPARRANLRRGDVIVAIDGQPVRDEVDLIRRLGATHAGHQVQLEVERGGRRMNQSVMLSKKYLNTVRPAIAAEPEPRWRGLQVEYATAMPKFPEQSLQFELGQCVGVIDVEADSPAWKAGLRPEMYVRRVAGRAVTTPAEFAAAVADQPGVVRLEVIRAGGSTTLRVEPQ